MKEIFLWTAKRIDKKSFNELLDLQFEGDSDSLLIINPEENIFSDSISLLFVP